MIWASKGCGGGGVTVTKVLSYDFVQYEVVVYIHFHFSLRFQALHGDAHNIIFVSFFKVVPD